MTNTNPPPKFFVDALRPDGRWVLGEIACLRTEAENLASELKLQHPDWMVEINPVWRSTLHPVPELPAAAVFSSNPMSRAELLT